MPDDKSIKKGSLYVVATPIGNLEDITLRALRILKEVGLIAAEDTRHTKILLKAYQINTPVTSLYDQNERRKSVDIVDMINGGMNVAYVSDAGTPGISDPGYLLINRAIAEKIKVVPVPGAAAAIAALSVSGLPMDRFVFCGFVPSRAGKRCQFLEEISKEQGTIILYESPNRLLSTLQDAAEIMGERQIVISRELTKVYEEIIRGTAQEIIDSFQGRPVKGEITMIVSGCRGKVSELSDEDIRAMLEKSLVSNNISRRDAIEKVVSETGISKHRVYNLAMQSQTKQPD